jgi:hypothetical protein
LKKQNQPLNLNKLLTLNKIFSVATISSSILFAVCLFSFTIFNTACVSKKKLSITKNLEEVNKSLIAENLALKGKLGEEIEKNKEAANKKGLLKEIDSSALAKILNFLDSSGKQADKDLLEPENLSSSQKNEFGEKLKLALSYNLNNVKIIGETLNLKTFILFKTGAMFKPGGYVIEDDTWKLALNAFSPVLDSIIQFVTKYPNNKFEASIAILGFSDASPVGKGGALFKMLTQKLNNMDADKATLNRELSQIRAEAVASVFEDLAAIKICKNNLSKNISLNIFAMGKGEELADPSLAGTPDNDERRRAVIAYWNVIPK